MSHRIEIVIGLVASALGVIGIGFAVFGPATFDTNPAAAATTSLWNQGLDSNTVTYLIVLLVAASAVPVGVYLRSYTYAAGGAIVLWVSAIVLILGAAITVPGNTTAIVPSALHTDTPDSLGIGIYLVPAALTAFVTIVVSTAVHHTAGRPVAIGPH